MLFSPWPRVMHNSGTTVTNHRTKSLEQKTPESSPLRCWRSASVWRLGSIPRKKLLAWTSFIFKINQALLFSFSCRDVCFHKHHQKNHACGSRTGDGRERGLRLLQHRVEVRGRKCMREELKCPPCSARSSQRPWFNRHDSEERNLMARKAFEALLVLTTRVPNTSEYDTFSKAVKRIGKEKYHFDYGKEEVRWCWLN